MPAIGIAAVAAAFGRDLDATFAELVTILDDARARGPGLVVLPEATLGGYLREPGPGETAAPDLPPALAPDGPEIRRLARLAGERGLVVCAGYTEDGGPAGPYASAVCVGGDGVLGHQRKVHLPPAERFAYQPGEAFAAFDTPVGRLGMVLCYDKLFPEAARALALDGATTIACPAAWSVDRRRPATAVEDDRQTRHFDAVDVARAVENQVTWVASNQVGPWGPLRFLGGAKVVDPDGVVLAGTGPRAGTAVARLDPDAAAGEVRLAIDHLADRRPAAYGRAPEPACALAGSG